MGILDALRQRGYEKEADLFKILEKESIHISTNKSTEESFASDESKIGGCPCLPANQEWPVFCNKPLAFLAQINLKEIAEYDTEKLLPSSGMLYFFHEGGEEVWGFDPKDKGGFKVIYSKDTENLTLTPLPDSLDDYLRFSPCKLTFAKVKSYPTDTEGLDEKLFAGMEIDDCFDIFAEEEREESRSKFFGYPDLIQGDIFLESQLVSNGLYCGDASGYENPKARDLRFGVKDWLLLFQIDSDDNADMMWGDCGRIYFTIKKADLAKCDFDSAWSTLQCY